MAVKILRDGETLPDRKDPDPSGIVAIGGTLDRKTLISAYSGGIFPWYSPGEPVMWWSPDPRMVLFPEEVHVSKSMKRLIRKAELSVTINRNFEGVIEFCRNTGTRRDGTWITDDMVKAYSGLHRDGYAHSIEVWKDGKLSGGFYGIAIGKIFFGESMFSLQKNASKYGLIKFSRYLAGLNFALIDCQVYTSHMASMGARMISGSQFDSILGDNIGVVGENRIVFGDRI